MQNEFLDGFQCLLPQSERMLPSYNNIIGKTFGDLTVIKLLRKNNRNILDCRCKCGNHQFLYRWQLKQRLSCSACGKYTKQHVLKTKDLDHQLFDKIKQENEDFQITYDYANQLLKQQHHRCVFTGSVLFALSNYNNCILDKINPQNGYVKNNVQWISKQISKMKGELSNKQFLQICNKISNRKITQPKEAKKQIIREQKLFL